MNEYKEIRSILNSKQNFSFSVKMSQNDLSQNTANLSYSQQEQLNISSVKIEDQHLQLLIRCKDRIQVLEQDNKYLRLYNKILEQEVRQLKQNQNKRDKRVNSSQLEFQRMTRELKRAIQQHHKQLGIIQQLRKEITSLKNEQIRRKNITREHRRWNQISSNKSLHHFSSQQRLYSSCSKQQSQQLRNRDSLWQLRAASIQNTPKKYNYVAKITKNTGFKLTGCDQNSLNNSRYSIQKRETQINNKQNETNQGHALNHSVQICNNKEVLSRSRESILRYNYTELKKNIKNATLFNKKFNQKITL